jgi:Glycosyl hydrolase family 81 C-terminal domain/Glycosyl hydrolase family 81 N-terminal domain
MDMVATIVKGMPYTTMEYNERNTTVHGDLLLPTIHSPFRLAKDARLDGNKNFDCSKEGAKALVNHEMELQFFESDFIWMVFFSEPVRLQCSSVGGTTFQVMDKDNTDSENPLIVRLALLSSCATGSNAISCAKGLGDRLPEEEQVKEYRSILRKYSRFYPGRQTSVSYTIEDDAEIGELIFDWDVQVMPSPVPDLNDTVLEEPSLINYALPHHLDILGSSHRPDGIKYCMSSMSGRACLVEGSTWTLREEFPRIGLQAARLPRAEFLSVLSDALVKDIDYSLPRFFERGIGDTYFSGKMLSKLGRILLIAEELIQICGGKLDLGQYKEDYEVACKNVTLPTEAKYEAAIDRLRRSVEIWINGTAGTPFVYDESWGGVVSCGCLFDGKKCSNKYPDCPAFSDQGLNFGNGESV